MHHTAIDIETPLNHLLSGEVDGRTRIVKRLREIGRALARDAGGADKLSEARAQLIQRFAATAVLAERLESRLAAGEEIDVQEHALICSNLVRLAQRIGLSRIARDVTPQLDDYIARTSRNDQQVSETAA
jgi:hypothetical protein